MNDFDKNVAQLKDQQTAQDPVLAAKRELAPIKAETQQAISDWRMLVSQLMPDISSARAQQEAAGRVGVRSPSLDDVLRRIGDMLNHGETGLRSVVEMIDGLTAYQAGQHRFRHDLQSGALLNQYRAVLGALRSAVASQPAHLATLERLVAEAAAHPPATLGPQSGPDIRALAESQRPRLGPDVAPPMMG